MKIVRKCTIPLFLLLFAAAVTGYGQTFDYAEKPIRKFNFLETHIDIQLNTEKAAVNGSVTYLLKPFNATVDRLILYASEISIDSVFSRNQPLKYKLQNDSLFITLTDSAFNREQFRVKIFYHVDPRFGLLKDSEGTVWTSLLPKSHRHWMPSPDYPGIETITTLSLTVPASFSTAATGVKTDEEILGLDKKSVTYRSSKPVPITSLAFAVGNFKTEGNSLGIKRIITYAEAGTVDRATQNKLANAAKQIINRLEGAAQMKYPYQRLHVVILNDHFWELKPYGATVIYLYENRGSLMNQLRRGLTAQWFGVYQHAAQWADAWPLQLFQSALHYKIEDKQALLKNEDSPETNFSTVYDTYSVDRWNFWQQMPRWETNTQQIATNILPQVLLRGSGTFTEQRYQNLWYRLSGDPIIKIPAAQSEHPKQSDNKFSYKINVQPAGDTLQVAFTATQKAASQPKTVSVKLIQGGSVSTFDATLRGSRGSFNVPVSPAIQNVTFNSLNDDISLKIIKPVPFILYQLDNANTMKSRIQAARQLGYHTANPDLQLLITGYLKKETEPEVKAALLQSYASITSGAAGTQQYFMKALGSPHTAVRQAALKGVQNYPNDAQITQRIRMMIEQGDSLNEDILKIYMQRIDSTEALGFVQTLVQQDTAGTKAIKAIAALAASGKTKPSVKLANYYIQPIYSYPVRKEALMVLLKYDDSAESWNKRIIMLLTDLDPRIRYLTIQNLSKIPGIKRGEVLQKYIPEAFDARIYKAIN